MKKEHDNNGVATVFLMITAFAMGSIGTALALDQLDHDTNWLVASLQGAVGAVVVAVLVASVYGYLRKRIWRHYRGYPFQNGDLVEVIIGYDAGRRGRVCGHDQGVWNYEVHLEGTDSCRSSRWIPASHLSRVRH